MNKLLIHFNLKDPRIKLKSKLEEKEIAKFETKHNLLLPKSYKLWLTNYSRKSYFDIGNALRLSPLIGFGFDTVSSHLKKAKYHIPVGLLPFASNGGGDYWAFYTKLGLVNDEYPIVSIELGSVDYEAYIYCNSSFDRFLNINVCSLMYGDNDEPLTYEEASDMKRIKASEKNFKEFLDDLYKKIDPTLVYSTSSVYEVVTFKSLESLLSKVING